MFTCKVWVGCKSCSLGRGVGAKYVTHKHTRAPDYINEPRRPSLFFSLPIHGHGSSR